MRNVLSPVLSGGCVITCSGFDPLLFWYLSLQCLPLYCTAPHVLEVINQKLLHILCQCLSIKSHIFRFNYSYSLNFVGPQPSLSLLLFSNSLFPLLMMMLHLFLFVVEEQLPRINFIYLVMLSSFQIFYQIIIRDVLSSPSPCLGPQGRSGPQRGSSSSSMEPSRPISPSHLSHTQSPSYSALIG